jgi:hypothetical protein
MIDAIFQEAFRLRLFRWTFFLEEHSAPPGSGITIASGKVSAMPLSMGLSQQSCFTGEATPVASVA